MTLEEALKKGYAKIVDDPETDNYFDVFGHEDPEQDAETVRHIEMWGLYYVRILVRPSSEARWELGASLGMVFGNDVDDTAEELWYEAEPVLESLIQREADELAVRVGRVSRDGKALARPLLGGELRGALEGGPYESLLEEDRSRLV